MAAKEMAWMGDEDRALGLYRPCPCGCDLREGRKGVGYLTGSDAEGKGFTVWIEDEVVYERIAAVLTAKAAA